MSLLVGKQLALIQSAADHVWGVDYWEDGDLGCGDARFGGVEVLIVVELLLHLADVHGEKEYTIVNSSTAKYVPTIFWEVCLEEDDVHEALRDVEKMDLRNRVVRSSSYRHVVTELKIGSGSVIRNL